MQQERHMGTGPHLSLCEDPRPSRETLCWQGNHLLPPLNGTPPGRGGGGECLARYKLGPLGPHTELSSRENGCRVEGPGCQLG